MEIYIECECGKQLDITMDGHSNNYINLIVNSCPDCEKVNYEAGEADAKEHG
jgi:hypothetical protein